MGVLAAVAAGLAAGVTAGLVWDFKLRYRLVAVGLVAGVWFALYWAGLVAAGLMFPWIMGCGAAVFATRIIIELVRRRRSQRELR